MFCVAVLGHANSCKAEAVVQCSISSPDGNTQTLSTTYSDCLERSLKTIKSDGENATARGLSRCTIAEETKVRIWWTTQSNCNAEIAIAKTNANNKKGSTELEDNNVASKVSQYEACGGAFMFAAVGAKLGERSAPEYARDRYEKRYQFFLQGGFNLQQLAKRDPKYNEKTYNENVDKACMDFKHNANEANDRGELESYTGAINVLLEQCVVVAGLNREDLPQ